MTSTGKTLPAFHVLSKPAGPICNMNCSYCFYLEKENLYPGTRTFDMPDDVLESYVRQYIEAQDARVVNFAWQGGEPTLRGIDFFRKAVALQLKYGGGRVIENVLQTNGVTLNDEWCEFFAMHNFLIGVSIDGPKDIHDNYRVFKGGQPTFDKVMDGIALLKKHRVEFNTLSCVHHGNASEGKAIYHFLKSIGSRYLQFIPVVERKATGARGDGLSLIAPDDRGQSLVTEWSLGTSEYGRFMADVFDEWVRADVGEVFVQLFDVSLANWYGAPPGLCVYSETCGASLAIEHNGDLYSCDHFVYPRYHLGNIMNTALGDMVNSPVQQAFGEHKRSGLPKFCRDCDVRFACHGGCPKQRFIETPDGEPGLNYHCEGYKHFFHHIGPAMEFMVNELQHQRPPANVMNWVKQSP